jgi:hypothetical protein
MSKIMIAIIKILVLAVENIYTLPFYRLISYFSNFSVNCFHEYIIILAYFILV